MNRATLFDIHHYALHDGPGIRTTVFFKGCPLSCLWCHNPESQERKAQRGYLREKCTRCGKCVESCPEGALRLQGKEIIWDRDRCGRCGNCADACLAGATELIGREMTVEEVLDAVEPDRPFYDNSGGGVTISGGEPTAQADFLFELLRALRERKIHTAVETCGYFNEGLIPRLCAHTDLFLYDLKHPDPETHRRCTGVSNQKILENFKSILAAAGREKVLPRIPLIPGVTALSEPLNAILDFLENAGYRGEVHLMPYNRLAKTKYEKIGRGRHYRDMGELTDDDIETLVLLARERRFTAVCNR